MAVFHLSSYLLCMGLTASYKISVFRYSIGATGLIFSAIVLVYKTKYTIDEVFISF
ncbi:hypothetical protein DJ95_3465 [Bacillus atrophaeus subsp. globigii]|nr:hypothetical protein DJ95_3465 [Bacillus atrophaeus subsp. globigii]